MRAKTFLELGDARAVSVEELKASLENYAIKGAPLLARVVTKLVQEVDPPPQDISYLIASAAKGLQNQVRHCQVEAATEYQELLSFLQRRRSNLG